MLRNLDKVEKRKPCVPESFYYSFKCFVICVLFLIVCLCVRGGFVDMNVGPYEGQKRVSDIPGAGVKASMIHPM